MDKPIDQEEHRFAQMMKVIESGVSAGDRAFLDQLGAQTAEAFRAAGAGRPQLRPIPSRSRLAALSHSHAVRRFALAASILVAALTGFAWWNTHHAGIAFAQVVDAVQRVQHCRFTITTTSDGAPLETRRVMIRQGTWLRQEMGDKIYIVDLEHGKFLALMPVQRRAITGDVKGLPEEVRKRCDDYLSGLKRTLASAEKVEDLGHRNVAGKNAKGFRITKDGEVNTVWVDPDSGLPLELSGTDEGLGAFTCTDFDFQVPLEESLFDLTPPAGYTVVPMNFDINVQDAREEDLIELLRLWLKATDGHFPDALTMEEKQLRDTFGALGYELGPLEGAQMVNRVARGAIFLAFAHNARYIGAGVTFGQADKPVFWYKPKDSDLYRVIYGDLSVREMPADQLPTVEKTAKGPARAAPAVRETLPADGALDVNPAAEIRITFDQDMRRLGQLWVEATEPNRYWSSPRKLVWLDTRTCRVSVQLKGDTRYVIHLNQWTDPAMYLKSGTGQPVPGWEMAFTTAPTTGEPALTAEQNRAAVERLRDTLRREYPHILNGFDLDGQVARHAPQIESCKGRSSFAVVLRRMLTGVASRRVEIWYGPNDPLHVSGTAKPGAPPANSSWDLLPRIVPNWRQMNPHSNAVMGGRFPGGIGYVTLHTWGDNESDPNKTTVYKAVTQLGDGKGLILDLRRCGGGGRTQTIEAIAGRFIDQPVLYGRETPRNTSAVAAGEPAKELRLQPNTAASRISARLVVLVGPGTNDVNERLALMLKQVPGCLLVGGTMVDDLGSNEPLDLGNGVRVMLPKYGVTLPDGTDVVNGVKPDIEVPATQGDFKTGRDPVLEAALRGLQE